MMREFDDLVFDGLSVPVTAKALGKFKDGYPVGGRYYSDPPRIFVSSHAPLDEQVRAIQHEALHHVFKTAGLWTKSPADEFIISRLTPWLVKFPKENPWFVEILQRG